MGQATRPVTKAQGRPPQQLNGLWPRLGEGLFVALRRGREPMIECGNGISSWRANPVGAVLRPWSDGTSRTRVDRAGESRYSAR